MKKTWLLVVALSFSVIFSVKGEKTDFSKQVKEICKEICQEKGVSIISEEPLQHNGKTIEGGLNIGIKLVDGQLISALLLVPASINNTPYLKLLTQFSSAVPLPLDLLDDWNRKMDLTKAWRGNERVVTLESNLPLPLSTTESKELKELIGNWLLWFEKELRIFWIYLTVNVSQ